MDAKNQKVAKTGKSGILLIIIAAAIVAAAVICGIIIAANPDILKDIVMIVLMIVIAIVVIIAIVAIAMYLLAIPFYIQRGEGYQENVDYDMDDVESVGEKKDKGQGGH